MQLHTFDFLGRRIELATHPYPDHLARAIGGARTFYELDVLMKCRARYLPGTAAIDVGANIGNHTVFFAAIIGARVHAFEPCPANHALLSHNVIANRIEDRVAVHRCALADAEGTGIIELGMPDNFGTTRVRSGAGDVTVRRLDDLDINEPVGLLKIDVEGTEAAVLRGAQRLITTWLPDICVEAGEADAFREVAALLLALGYAPSGRYAWTPTYLFTALDQAKRLAAILA
jgi:FkbM family methyltransferase